MTVDIPIKDIGDTKGNEINPLPKLGFDHSEDEFTTAWNGEESALYLAIIDISGSSLHIYKEVDLLQNEWVQKSPDGGYSLPSGATSIGYPLVTHENTLLFGVTNYGIVRTEDWGETVENPTSCNPLYWKHAQDADGAIFAGHYKPDGNARIEKSTDDGQTWTQIIDLSTNDDHIHGVAAAPHRDIIGITWGDSEQMMAFCHKDGSVYNEINTLGEYGATSLQQVPIMPLDTPRDDATGSEVFIDGNDASASPFEIVRRYVRINDDDGSLAHRLQYSTQYSEREPDVPFVTDLDTINGRIVALGGGGRKLLVSDDGFMWDEIPVKFASVAIPRFRQNLTETDEHIIISRQSLLALPKNIVNHIRPESTTYSLFDGTQPSTSSREDLFNALPAYDKAECVAHDTETGGEIFIRKMPIRSSLVAVKAELTSFNLLT